MNIKKILKMRYDTIGRISKQSFLHSSNYPSQEIPGNIINLFAT